jgi:hypothetical protein
VLTLLALNAVLAACVLAAAWRGTETAALLAVPPRPVPLPEHELTRPVSPTELAAIADRALLYASRHVYTAPPANLAPARPNYQLAGTILIPSKPAVALLTGPQEASRKVKPGDTLDGWLVEAVERHRVLLRHESDTFEIADAVSGSAGSPGVQRAPLVRLAQSSPPVGARPLGPPIPPAPRALNPSSPTRSAPRLYQPPPNR